MKKQYVKNPIPVELSEGGGASIVFVNKQTVPLDGAISEALAGNYCTGQKTLIRNFAGTGPFRTSAPRQNGDAAFLPRVKEEDDSFLRARGMSRHLSWTGAAGARPYDAELLRGQALLVRA